MNLTDLRDELDLHALEVKADACSLAAGVAGKVRATKRRRAAAGVAAACALAAVAGGGLWSGLDRSAPSVPAVSSPVATVGTDGLPMRAVPDAPGDVVKDGLRLRDRVADDALVAGVIGDPGQQTLTARWLPTTTQVSFVAECYVTGRAAAEPVTLMARTRISGVEGYTASGCTAQRPPGGDLPNRAWIPGEPAAGLASLAVGKDATISVELVDRDGKAVTNSEVRLVLGVYELGAQRLIEDEDGTVVAALPEVVEHQGYRYRLERLASGSVAKGQLPTLEAPSSGPYLVTHGTSGTGDPVGDLAYFRLDGLVDESSLVQEGGLTTAAQAAGSGQTLDLVVAEETMPKQGIGVIAVYVPEH